MAGLMLRSSAFNDHDLMPERLSKMGGNVSPPLEWSGVPENTTELILLCEDHDAGSEPFLHWLVTGIDPVIGGMPEGQTPVGGQEWPNGFGGTGWAGPQPPRGDDPHRYFFRLYAVAGFLDLPTHPHANDVHQATAGHERASGTLVGRFAR